MGEPARDRFTTVRGAAKAIASLVRTRRSWINLGSLIGLVAVLTYLQNRYVVQVFGAGVVLDDYYLATTVPMAVSAMFGVVTTGLLVPELTESLRVDGVVRGAGRVMGASLAILVSLVTVSVPFARAIGLWGTTVIPLAPTIAVCGGAVAYGMSFVAQPYLVSTRRQSWFLAAQAASNVVFVAALWLGLRGVPDGIYLAFALGGAAQAATSLGGVVASRDHVSLGGAVQGLDRLRLRVASGLPAVLCAVLLAQGGVLVDRWFMKAVGVGAITCYLLADRIVQVTVASGLSVIGLHVFPRMTGTTEGKRYTGLAVSSGGALMVPLAAGLFLAAGALIRLLFLGGNFDLQSAGLTSSMLAILAVSLPALAIVQIAPRRLQFAGTYWRHVAALAIGLSANLAIKVLTMHRWGALGLVGGTVGGALVSAVVYCAFLGVGDRSFSRADARDLGLSLLLGVAVTSLASFVPAPPLLVAIIAAAMIVVGIAALRVRGLRMLVSGGEDGVNAA